MIRTISRGLSNMEELERVETEEAAKIGILGSEMPLIYLSSNINEPSIFIIDWSFIPPISPFSPGLFADLGIFNIVEMSLDTWLNF